MSRNVYLPAGADWRDLHSRAVHAGGKTISVDAPLSIIPVFQRVGGTYATLIPADVLA